MRFDEQWFPGAARIHFSDNAVFVPELNSFRTSAPGAVSHNRIMGLFYRRAAVSIQWTLAMKRRDRPPQGSLGPMSNGDFTARGKITPARKKLNRPGACFRPANWPRIPGPTLPRSQSGCRPR
jgi:hypothetical protein